MWKSWNHLRHQSSRNLETKRYYYKTITNKYIKTNKSLLLSASYALNLSISLQKSFKTLNTGWFASSFQRRFNLFLGKLSRPLNLLAQRMWYPKGEKMQSIGHWGGLLEPETTPCFVCWERCAYIQNVVYVSIWTIYMYGGKLHLCILVSACFSSHAWGASCLKSWNRTQIDNHIANKQKWQQQKWNLFKTDKKWQK